MRCGTYLIGSIEHVETEQLEVEVLPLHRMTVELGQRHEDVVVYKICSISLATTSGDGELNVPTMRSKRPIAMTGKIVQNEFQNRR